MYKVSSYWFIFRKAFSRKVAGENSRNGRVGNWGGIFLDTRLVLTPTVPWQKKIRFLNPEHPVYYPIIKYHDEHWFEGLSLIVGCCPCFGTAPSSRRTWINSLFLCFFFSLSLLSCPQQQWVRPISRLKSCWGLGMATVVLFLNSRMIRKQARFSLSV